MDYEFFMQQAIEEAKKAYKLEEVPIGCVIVYKDNIIATGYNKRNTQKNSIKHAEIIAIEKACKVLGDWRLEGCSIFVTVEPCPMCSGAILQARMDRVVFGCYNKKAGCCGSILNLLDNDNFNHKVEVVDKILEEECAMLMKSFFKDMRSKNK